jgi:amino acid transporter
MKSFDVLITFIILIKFLFIIFSLIHLNFIIKKDEENKINIEAVYWRNRLEFIFTISMAILLIYLFNPRYNNENLITPETKLLLYLFGFILIIIAEWGEFIRENKLFTYLQKVFKN